MLVAVFIALIFSLTLFVRSASQNDAARTRDLITEEALAQAKTALVAWSVLQGDIGSSASSRRPGTLPCPDTNNSGTQAASCSGGTGTSIGHLPWKTLGIVDLRDAYGERLWYAVSDSFRRVGLNNNVINSNTQGTLKLYAPDGTTLLTPAGQELAAIIFSPGPPLAGQNRQSVSDNVTDYLEASSGRNNANSAGPFISGPVKTAQGDTVVNDRVLSISARELIRAVEARVLGEAQRALAAYALANSGKYPNPAKPSGPYCSNQKSGIDDTNFCRSDNTVCFGRLPEDVLVQPYAALWFYQNGWGRVFTYAVNVNSTIDPSASECTNSLYLDGIPKSYVLVAPGTAMSGQTRPSSSLVDYLEDAANNDAWTPLATGQATFVTPTSSSNDQIRSQP